MILGPQHGLFLALEELVGFLPLEGAGVCIGVMILRLAVSQKGAQGNLWPVPKPGLDERAVLWLLVTQPGQEARHQLPRSPATGQATETSFVSTFSPCFPRLELSKSGIALRVLLRPLLCGPKESRWLPITAASQPLSWFGARMFRQCVRLVGQISHTFGLCFSGLFDLIH